MNEDIRFGGQQQPEQTPKLWAEFEEALDKLAEKAGISTEVIEEKQAEYLDDVVAHIIDPELREKTLKSKEAGSRAEEMDEIADALYESSVLYNEAIEALNKPIVLTKLKATEFRAEEIKKKDSPIMKMMKKAILESTKPTVSRTSMYVPATTKCVDTPKEPKAVITPNKGEEEIGAAVKHFDTMKEDKINILSSVIEEHKQKMAAKYEGEETGLIIEDVETVDTSASYTEGYMS